MNKIPLLLFIFFSISGWMNAQIVSDLFPRLEQKNQVILHYEEESNNTAFTNSFASMYHNSEHIDRETLLRERSYQQASNLLGQKRKFELSLLLKDKEKEDRSYYIGLSHQRLASLYYNDEAVDLVFFGNKAYRGDSINIPFLKSYALYIEQIKLGQVLYFKSASTRSFFQWSGAFSIGQNYHQLDITDSYFYTAPDGEFIDIEAHAIYEASDTSWTNIFVPSGKGISADIQYGIEIQNRYYLEANIRNIGFLSWSKTPQILSTDTTIHFEGVHIDIDGMQDTTSTNPLTKDIMHSQYVSSFIRMTPVSLSATAGMYFLEKKVFIGSKLRYFTHIHNRILFSLWGSYQLRNETFISVKSLYGGFGNWNIGMHIVMPVNKKIRMQAGTDYLNSIFAKHGRGLGWNVSFRYSFNK
jgi:hypothetical protein